MTIWQHNSKLRQKARVTAYKRREDGSSTRDKILNVNQKMTAGKLVSECRSHHLGKHVLDQAEQRESLRKTQLATKVKNDEIIYIKSCIKAETAIRLNTHQSNDVSKWNKNHILDLIRPLKMEGDKAMPPNKPELYQRYLETRHRVRRPVDELLRKEYKASLLVMDDFDIADNDDVSVESDRKENLANEFTGTSL